MYSLSPLPDEGAVLDRLKQSDEAAFAEIYNCYWKPLFYVAASRLKSLTDAEEIVQDVFLDIWNRRHELTITTCLSAYLAVCVKYRVINLLARKSRRLQFQQALSKQAPAADFSAENTVDFSCLKTQLEKETARLPDKCQLVFRLSREEGYSHKEIAARLRISEKTVESHLTKALRQLRAGLSHILSVWMLVWID